MNSALSTELKSQQIGREKGQHAIIFHCQVEICIAVSCRFSLLLLSFLPPVRALCCAGTCLTPPSSVVAAERCSLPARAARRGVSSLSRGRFGAAWCWAAREELPKGRAATGERCIVGEEDE